MSFCTGPESKFSIEHRLLNIVGYFSGLIGIMTVIINIIIDSPVNLTIFSGMVAVVCWFIFYISRFRNKFNLGRWVITLFMFAVFGHIFYINNGSQGPMLYLYLIFFLLVLFIWKGRERIFFIALYTLIITALFLIELNFPDLIKPYEFEKTRIMDVYLSYYLFVILGGVILMFAKNSYIKEKVKAEQSDKLKSAFLANMSHEIRTPMNAILGFTQLLGGDLSKEKKDEFLKIIKDNSQSLLRLIEDIIDISRIEAEELEIIEVDVDLNALIADLGSTFKQTLKNYSKKEIEIVEEIPRENRLVIADKTRLKQIVINLVSNALKYTEKGKITIGYNREGDWLRFFVKDTGRGIQKEHIKEIFDRFRKIETEASYQIQPGTGIGLSIAKNLVRLMGGTLEVESKYGEGSEFYFTIPFKPSSQKIPVPEEKLSELQLSKINLSGKSILVVEDERTNFEFLQKVIERTGAEVLHAENGREAVNIFSENPKMDLILMDIMMPEMNGYEATKAIKKIMPEVPVIAQTALAMEGDEGKVLDSGCDDYISKPIRINELLRMITKHIINK
jgi:signal transduction histidine kinase/CheY-like chemotaxis protein